MRATTRPTLDERRAARDAASTQPRRPQPQHPKTTPFDFIRRIAAPYSLNAGYLWSGAPLCRVEPDTRRVDPIDLPEDEPRAGGPGSKLQPTTRTAYRLGHLGRLCEWIEPLPDESHVIAGNVHRLWLIPALASAPTTQPATAPSTQPATQK
jgi:hypothetical protein